MDHGEATKEIEKLLIGRIAAKRETICFLNSTWVPITKKETAQLKSRRPLGKSEYYISLTVIHVQNHGVASSGIPFVGPVAVGVRIEGAARYRIGHHMVIALTFHIQINPEVVVQ